MTRYLDESDVMMVEEGFTTRDLLESLLLKVAQTGSREAFFVANLEDVVKKHVRLLKALPRVKPLYPLKCNSSRGVVQMLAGLGAGFSCTNKTAAVINSALDLYFPEGCGVEILAELGRYYVHSAFTLVVNVIAKKEVPLDQLGSDEEDAEGKKSFVYHINDGVYGSLGSVIFSNICPVPILPKKPPPDLPLHNSSFWGPTGDELDRIADGLELPELQVGDWLIFENMGAHSVLASSSFQGSPPTPIHYAMSRVAWEAVQLLQGKSLYLEEEDRESTCAPLSCGWEITDTLCVVPVFTPASIM
ncbi:PREDICTED: antizyme inhibitor 2-like [Thamnophis sirtalis]|uniref:Antizyme inhibitor 2 n=1 Tax=Thamnophis sirtalis TaxID=35019 RepID=A0A6I9Z0A1_9SAUR|nr:PREDICTED: antizyme inhibitor 2-like [Thamnophis sirtalis]